MDTCGYYRTVGVGGLLRPKSRPSSPPVFHGGMFQGVVDTYILPPIAIALSTSLALGRVGEALDETAEWPGDYRTFAQARFLAEFDGPLSVGAGRGARPARRGRRRGRARGDVPTGRPEGADPLLPAFGGRRRAVGARGRGGLRGVDPVSRGDRSSRCDSSRRRSPARSPRPRAAPPGPRSGRGPVRWPTPYSRRADRPEHRTSRWGAR